MLKSLLVPFRGNTYSGVIRNQIRCYAPRKSRTSTNFPKEQLDLHQTDVPHPNPHLDTVDINDLKTLIDQTFLPESQVQDQENFIVKKKNNKPQILPFEERHDGVDYSVEHGLYVDTNMLEAMEEKERRALTEFKSEMKEAVCSNPRAEYITKAKARKADNFTELGLDSYFQNLFDEQRPSIKKPTPVQNAVIPAVKEGLDVLVQSQSGAGKTYSFLLPLVEKCLEHKQNGSCIIFVPYQELAYQIYSEIEFLIRKKSRQNFVGLAVACRDDFITLSELQDLSDRKRRVVLPTILVATPKHFRRLLDSQKSLFPIKNIKHIVVDEADLQMKTKKKHERFDAQKKRLMSPKPLNEILSFLQYSKVNPQMIVCSASLNSQLRFDLLGQNFVRDPVVVRDKSLRIPEEVEHEYYRVYNDDKLKGLIEVLKARKATRGLIIIQNEGSVQMMADLMRKESFDAVPLYELIEKRGLQGLELMENVVKDSRFYVCRESTAFGLDTSSLGEVYLLNFPSKLQGYLHVCGRAGIAGKPGRVTSIANGKDEYYLQKCWTTYDFEPPTTWSADPIGTKKRISGIKNPKLLEATTTTKNNDNDSVVENGENVI